MDYFQEPPEIDRLSSRARTAIWVLDEHGPALNVAAEHSA